MTWIRNNDVGRKHVSGVESTKKEMAKLEKEKKRIVVAPADESMTYDEQSERIRRIASASLVKLHHLLDSADTPGAVAAIVSALLDAQKLARTAEGSQGNDPGIDVGAIMAGNK